jgi:hypothetical protein
VFVVSFLSNKELDWCELLLFCPFAPLNEDSVVKACFLNEKKNTVLGPL